MLPPFGFPALQLSEALTEFPKKNEAKKAIAHRDNKLNWGQRHCPRRRTDLADLQRVQGIGAALPGEQDAEEKCQKRENNLQHDKFHAFGETDSKDVVPDMPLQPLHSSYGQDATEEEKHGAYFIGIGVRGMKCIPLDHAIAYDPCHYQYQDPTQYEKDMACKVKQVIQLFSHFGNQCRSSRSYTMLYQSQEHPIETRSAGVPLLCCPEFIKDVSYLPPQQSSLFSRQHHPLFPVVLPYTDEPLLSTYPFPT